MAERRATARPLIASTPVVTATAAPLPSDSELGFLIFIAGRGNASCVIGSLHRHTPVDRRNGANKHH
jgi:hypothetical protein